jgi:hypothetical protein
VLAAVSAVVLLLCLGFTPVVLSSFFGGDDANGGFGENACGTPELAIDGLADIKGFSEEQIANAAIIIQVGAQLRVPPRGWVIAIATALQESTLHNHKVALDHDSLGIFQQRPSMGWGTPAQLTDPRYASAKFYESLKRKAPGWERMRLSDAAQRVQVSINGSYYQKWEPTATALVNQLAKGAASGVTAGMAGNARCALPGEVSGAGWTVPAPGVAAGGAGGRSLPKVGSGFHAPGRPNHQGVDIIAQRGDPIVAAAAGLVVTSMCQASTGNCDVDGGVQVKGCGWYVKIRHAGGLSTLYCHMGSRPLVSVGDRVNAGQVLGKVGSSGNSSGPHLHFEVRVNGVPINPVPFMVARGASLSPQR